MLPSEKGLKRITDFQSLESGELIALRIDGQITRALVQISVSALSLFLIDIGEEVKHDESIELYHMAKYYKHLPAQAVLCKVEGLPKKYDTSKFLNKTLHEEVEVEVLSVKYNTIHVKFVLPNVESLISESSSDVSDVQSKVPVQHNMSQFPSTNPFLSDLCDNMNISKKVEVKAEEQTNKNNAMENFFQDNQTGTSNAMVAVMGYDPKDEARFCKHYDEKTGACFKGPSCTFVHQKPLDDGWTRDQIPAFVAIAEQIPVPAIRQKIKIEMCFCEDIDSFYGFILNPEFHRSGAMSLNSLNREINKPDNMKKYKKFTSYLPCKFLKCILA